MKYVFQQENYATFSTFEVNKLPPRSYFISYPDRKSADAVSLAEKRYKSPKVRCLNGAWDFKFYQNPNDLPAVFDTDAVSFDKLAVPSCWQFKGYLKPFYVNSRYQFPYDPPVIPTLEKAGRVFMWHGADKGPRPRWEDPGEEYNSVGVYRTFFTAADPEKSYIISFLGVASCLDLYLNGTFVGYSEGAHNTAEFDLSPYITAGKNELVAVVHRWCNGTYLECQDMFRNNGIFRDVLLRESDPADVWDIAFATKKTGEGYIATVRVELCEEAEVIVSLEGNGLSEQQKAVSKDKTVEVVFGPLDVTEWNAEAPTLYDLYVEVPGSCTKLRVGFKDVAIHGTLLTLNGRKVKFHGVNHHDTSCTGGYTMTPEEIERDMRLCKEFNVDTVRTSHYPPDPYLLELADELGIYLVDEADLETHGTFFHKLPPSYNLISDDPAWEAHYVDRAKRLYQRDKTHVSVVMWSLGNEAGGDCCMDAMYAYLKSQTTLPVHYESAIHAKRKAYDVGSEMYPPIERVHKIGEKTYRVKQLCDRPYFLCEYAHAMGVGPGNVEGYWKEIYAYDNLTGGCIWEMVDHAVLEADGSYTYGGDHGEWEHDGNFCVDGLFYPDRTPSTGARIMRFVYRPIRVSHLHDDVFEVFNTTGFSEGSRYQVKGTWSTGGTVAIPVTAGPLAKAQVRLDTKAAQETAALENKDLTLTVVTTDTVTGREVGREQLFLSERFPAAPADAGTVPLPNGFRVTDGKVTLPLKDGALETVGTGILLYRAPTDNDFVMFGVVNSMSDFIGAKEEVLSVESTPNRVTVKTKVTGRKQAFMVTDTYEGSADGIVVTSRLRPIYGLGDVPRFAKSFRLDRSFEDVSYYGRNGESYPDMKDQTQLETVFCKVSDMTEPNIKPQESGNRMDTRWAQVSNGAAAVTFTALDKAYELGIKPYTDEALLSMKHQKDEVCTGTYVTLSAFQKGIGTGSCGPSTAKEFTYPADRPYELKFLIKAE